MRRYLPFLGPVAAFTASFLAFLPANGQSDADPWVPINDQSAVTFGQIPPTSVDPNSVTTDWTTGLVFANYQQLYFDGFTDGYIQVVAFDESPEEGTWVVQNLPIINPSLLAGASMEFELDPPTGPVAGTNAAVYHTHGAQKGGPAKGTNHTPPNGNAMPKVNPVKAIPVNSRGMVPQSPVPNPPPVFNPIFGKNPPADVDPLTSDDSVEQDDNQCAPAAVANSMEYLKKMFMLDDMLMQTPGIAGVPASSRVGQIDVSMNRKKGQTVTYANFLSGKFQYLKNVGLDKKISVETQGLFGAKEGSSGKTVTPQFITDQLKAKEDVELCFSWVTGGAHCVHATGFKAGDGYLNVTTAQDAQQGKAGGITAADGGHPVFRIAVGTDGRYWIITAGQNKRPIALITHVMGESPKK